MKGSIGKTRAIEDGRLQRTGENCRNNACNNDINKKSYESDTDATGPAAGLGPFQGLGAISGAGVISFAIRSPPLWLSPSCVSLGKNIWIG